RSAVHGDEWAAGACAHAMNAVGDQLLAAAAFSDDENGRLGGRHFLDHAVYLADLRRGAVHEAEPVRGWWRGGSHAAEYRDAAAAPLSALAATCCSPSPTRSRR